MILSKLQLHGFKSFGKKEELRFDGSITAVVGPNGCGKTNIVDAIRWGLGEQRPSILRADRMDTIIFGGSQSARPLGMAEVSITFDNRRHILPIDYNEVVVTRRLYRSGESEYLLNKSPVRLKDIQDLLMDTGIGADAYSVIELKMIEDILSEKAEDRRRLLEEAAGVTKYKHRLKAALRKLDATQNDLLRVNDIITEVERNVRSLKRQVQRARRYQELQEELKELDLRRSYQVYQTLKGKVDPLQKAIRDLQKQKEGRTTKISKEEADLESLRLEVTGKEKAFIAAQDIFNKASEKIHHIESDIRVGKERVYSLENRIERNQEEVESLSKRLDEQKNHQEVTQRDREGLQVKITSAGRIFTNKKKELEVFQQGLNLQRLNLNKYKKEIIECLEEINQLNGDEAQYRTQIDNSRGRLERLEEEDKEFEQAKVRIARESKKHTGDHQRVSEKKNALTHTLDQLAQDEAQAQKNLESIREQLYKDQSELDLISGRMRFMQQIIESREGLSDGSKVLLAEKVDGLQGVLADFVQTAPEYRAAIEAALGESAQYLVMTTMKKVISAIHLLKRRGGGRVTLIAADRAKAFKMPKQAVLDKKIEGIVGWAADLTECDASVKPILQYLLQDVLIVKDLDASDQIIKALANQNIRMVSLQGEMTAHWGVVQSSPDQASESGMIGRKQRVEELEKSIAGLKQKIQKTHQQIASLESRLHQLKDERKQKQSEWDGLEQQYHALEKLLARLQLDEERTAEGLQRNSVERKRLLDEIEKGREGLESIRPKLEQVMEKRDIIEKQTSQVQHEVDRLEQEERALEEEVHRQNLSIVRLNGEAKNLDYDLERSVKLIEEIQKTIQTRKTEVDEASAQIKTQTAENEKNEKLLIEAFEIREKSDKDRGEKETAYHELQESLQTREREIRSVRQDRENVAEQIHQMEMEISDLNHQIGTLSARIVENYDTDLKSLIFEEDMDLTGADEQIDDIRVKIKNIGPVNILALEEYDQENERFTFLTQQRDDLLSAEETLKDTIKKINDTARERFVEVFDEVRKNFKIMYARFFKGGEADLRLEQDMDPLEARIEIMARPAGKQLRAIDLLSGGEKALTAISLLFALYMVKPSPFCILDEVDAPLDDANVERFTHVLNEYAQNTQFVIVSHNKMTMKAAQALYGVTMEEEGVSKIVSVKFNESQN